MIAHTIKRIVCLGCLSLAAADMSARDRALEKSIRTFLRDRQATVAVAVLNDGRMIASIEGKAELPTMSVFKFYQALAVLDPAGGSGLSPDSLLSFGESQLPRDTHSPLRDSIPQGGTLAVRDLIRYALIVSDNNACDILLAAAGGPETVDRYVRRQGIRGVTIAATEQTMHERFENQYLNRTTAEAAVRMLERLDTGGLLPAERRKLVEEAMIASRTGSRRIRSVLLSFGESQLPRDTHSPLRDSIPQGGTLAVRDLIRYALIVSDNNACDILLAAAGGPETVDRYVRRQGIRGVTIAATEQTMHERFENQYLNRTTAEAAVRMLERLDTGGLLPAERRKLVEEAMIASRTGSRRIRSVLPGDVVAGDKTGSSLRSAEGMTAADNDLAFVRLPDGTTYYMAVLVANSFEDDRTNEATIAGISRIVYDYFVERE